MTGDQDLIGFTFVASGNPLVQPFDDSVCHRNCLSEWSHRDRFILAWNKEAMYSLGPGWFLDINSAGKVNYLTAFDRLTYALRLKRSSFLPKHVSRRWPLLKLSLYHGCRTPLTLSYNYSYAHSWPTARQLGVSTQLANTIDAWLEEYHTLCNAECSEDAPTPGRWINHSKCGREIWNALCDEIGNLYRVVYLAPGCILEPESLDEQNAEPDLPTTGFIDYY